MRERPSAVLLTAGQVEAMAMRHLALTFFFSCLFVQLVPLSTADDGRLYFPKEECISERGNYTDDSTYQANLSSLLASFSNAQVEYGFYNSSVGEVNGIGLCSGDVSADTCRSCIGNSTQDIRSLCPNYKEAILYQDNCMLRYSNRSILGIPEYRPPYILYNGINFSEPEVSREKRDTLLVELREKAASGGTLLKYATGEAATSRVTIYAQVQCTPDLDYQECVTCVGNLSGGSDQYFRYKQGGRAMAPSCGFRYEIYPFYGSLADAPAPSPPSPPPPLSNDGTTGDGMLLIRTLMFSKILVIAFRSKPATYEHP